MRISFNINAKLKNKEVLYNLAKNVLWKAMNKVEELAKMHVPVDTGRLKNSIHVFPMASGYNRYTVSDGVEYGIYVEFGTAPHIITPIQAQALSFEWTNVGGEMIGTKRRRELKIPKSAATRAVFKKVMHPGTNAQPFMRPSVDEVNRYWVNVFWQQELAKSL